MPVILKGNNQLPRLTTTKKPYEMTPNKSKVLNKQMTMIILRWTCQLLTSPRQPWQSLPPHLIHWKGGSLLY